MRSGRSFTVVVHYDGVPAALEDGSGVLHTDDGVLIIGEPHVASSWFPVNDHPSDKATYTIKVTVPKGLEAVSNGVLKSKKTRGGHSTFIWEMSDPMASYLATAAVGKFVITSYKKDGLRFYDAIDPTLFGPVATPTTRHAAADLGPGGLVVQAAHAHDRRARGGRDAVVLGHARHRAELGLHVRRGAHGRASTTGRRCRTRMATRAPTRAFSCPFGGWQAIHPFLAHYQTDNGDGTCASTGTTRQLVGGHGSSDGSEQWKVDLVGLRGQDGRGLARLRE